MSTRCKNSEIPVFKYLATDFNFTTFENIQSESKFDRLLKEHWEKAETNNVFRYKLDIKKWKILDGQYQLLAQLNIKRGTDRREPETISSMNQPFDPNKFNFTKLPEKEICFDIEDGSGNNIIATNVSPIEWGHCLFIPQRLSNLPQKITRYSLRKAIELILLSLSPNLRIIFNGLCAFASVNHLHWHMYYLKHRQLLETIKLNELIKPVCTLENFPSKGFCVRLALIPGNNIEKLVEATYLIIQFLQDNEMAHNIFITRGKCNPKSEIFDDVRVYIWARKPNYGIKDMTAFTTAACELSGLLIMKSEETYENATEASIASILHDETYDTFLSVRDNIQLVISKHFLHSY